MKTKNTIKLSLLTAMHFNTSMTRKELYYVVSGIVPNAPSLITTLIKEGKIIVNKNDIDKYNLTKKGLTQVLETDIELIKKTKTGEKQIVHNLALSRAIFLIMLTLDNSQILSIQKEKGNQIQQPDITLQLQNRTIYIEIDTGTQAPVILEGKIKSYKLNNITPLFITKSQKNYEYLKENLNCHILLLDSENILSNLLMIYDLSSTETKPSTEPLEEQTTTTTTTTKIEIENENKEKHKSILDKFFK